MKLKLVIKNELENGLYYERYNPETNEFVSARRIEQYDENKWKNGSIYEFNTLKEMCEFIDTCDIDFTSEYANYEFSEWSWEEIDIDYYIDPSKDNLMIMIISSYHEFRD